MKKTTIIIFAVFCAISAFAQSPAVGVMITDVRVVPSGDRVEVAFTAAIDRRAVRSDYELVLTPVLYKGNTHRAALLPIVVQGRRARISAQRRQMSFGADTGYGAAILTGNGRRVNYTVAIPYEQWMEGSDLFVGGLNRGCCSEKRLGDMTLTENLTIVPPAPVAEAAPAPEPAVIRQPTTGERLASSLSFVAEAGGFDAYRRDPDRYIAENREGSLIVYFRQNMKTIDFSYRDNRRSLDQLLAAVDEIQRSSDSRIERVVIAGFASPEGGIAVNTRLAGDRAETARRYLTENSSLRGDQIEIFNGLVDWLGLKTMVEKSDMAYKRQILEIIDNVPVWDAQRNTGRLGQLMRLGGGEPYRYMFRNFFPELRNAAFIKIYYRNLN